VGESESAGRTGCGYELEVVGYRGVVDEGVCDHDGVIERVIAGCKAVGGLLASPIL
jgi:hypothetical protein